MAQREEFKEAVNKLFGDLSNEQVQNRIFGWIEEQKRLGRSISLEGISAEYIRKMRKLGTVPKNIQMINAIAGAFDSSSHALMVAAGYEDSHPADIYKPERIIAHLRSEGKLSPKAIKEIEDLLAEVEDAHKNNRPHN